jgi:hypothetical protein
MCLISTKTFETLTHAIWDMGSYDFVFVPEPSGHPIQDLRLIQIHFHAIQPTPIDEWGWGNDVTSYTYSNISSNKFRQPFESAKNTLAARGLEELVFQLCCCVSFWFWREIGFGFTYLCTLSTIQLWHCVLIFWFWQEKVFGVTYVLSVQYSCVDVSVFWLWQEMVLNMRTRFSKKILLGYFIMIH